MIRPTRRAGLSTDTRALFRRLGALLSAMRATRGASEADAAASARLDVATLRRIEEGGAHLLFADVARLAAWHGVALARLLAAAEHGASHVDVDAPAVTLDARELQRRLARRVIRLRQDEALPRETFADRVGLSVYVLETLERDRPDIALRSFAAIAAALDVPLSELVASLLAEGAEVGISAYVPVRPDPERLDDFPRRLGRVIRHRREQLGVSRSDLAQTVDASLRGVELLERGSRRATVELLDSVAQALGVPLWHLVQSADDVAVDALPEPRRRGRPPKLAQRCSSSVAASLRVTAAVRE